MSSGGSDDGEAVLPRRVRFVRDGVPLPIWQAMATRAGGDLVIE